MAKTLEAHDKLVREIFSDAYEFFIPEYQRPYAWTTEQTLDLFEDLLAAMSDPGTSDSPGQYFLGSIVLIKQDRETKAYVVDGQQRLTTLTILLAALRTTMPDAAEDITPYIYRRGAKLLGEQNGYRLTAREEDAAFFREHIQDPCGISKLAANADRLEDSRLRYRENAVLLLGKLEALSSEQRICFFRFLITQCSVVVISTPDLDAAYRIFSVLNNRGLDLAAIDILKADILGRVRKTAGEAKSREYAKKWSQMEASLGRDGFGELFGHIRAMYAKQKQQATLVKEFHAHVTSRVESLALIDHIIEPYAQVWNWIRDAEFQSIAHAEAINDTLNWLNRIDFKDWVPPALTYCQRFRHKPALLLSFLVALERLTYCLAVTRAGVNDRIDTYARLTAEIEAETFDGDASALKNLSLTETQRADFLAGLDGDVYRRLPKVRLALILRLENLLSDGSKKQDFAHLSLEHVLPQTPPPNSEWMRWFPDDDLRDSWTHRIANLVPLHVRKNPAASNYEFRIKKDVYFTGKGKASPFILTNEVRALGEWTLASLAERQERLVGVLAQHWDLRASGSTGGSAVAARMAGHS